MRHSLATLLATSALGVVLGQNPAFALDGTWTGATSTEWTDGTNWTSTPTVPDGVATFTNTGSTTVDSNGLVGIGGIVFTAAPNAQGYTVNINDIFVVNGVGVSNNSTNLQTFNVSSSLVFSNASSANGGTGGVIYNVTGGSIAFSDTSTAGASAIINGGDVEFNNSSNAGTATITNNAVINFNDTSSASSANISNNATGFLAFNTSASAGSAVISNDGSITFNNSSTAGNATITTNNGGTTSFTGTSSGGTASFITLTGGTFDISGLTSAGLSVGSIAGAGSYVLGAKTLTTGSNNTTTVMDGVISGIGGGLTKVGTGTLTLTGANTYTGATTISAGTLALSGSGSIASSSIVTVNGTLDISAIAPGVAFITTLAGSGAVQMGIKDLLITNGSTEFSGAIQGTGGVQIGSGTQTLSGANTYSNATKIAPGATLALKGNGSIANSFIVAFGAGAGGTLDISQTTSGASVQRLSSPQGVGIVALGSKTLTITNGSFFGGAIQDGGIGGGAGGNLLIANGAFQQLGGTNTYTGTTTIAGGGELALVALGGTNGSIAASSSVVANGIFDISGLTNGGTSIKSLSGAGSVNLGGNTLTITNGNGTFAGVIGNVTGTGNLVLTGGTQVLSFTNTYTGSTTVNGGTLVVDGSIASSALTTVNAGGTLAGSGTVGNTAIVGGTLAPGSAASAFGPLTVNGSLSFTAASTYLVQVSSTNAGLTNVLGTAALGNATVNANFVSGTVQKKYTILNATGGFGGSSFNPTVASNMPTISASLSYDTNNVFLNIGLDFKPTSGNLTINQQNVANTLTNFFNSTGGIPAAFAGLTPAGLTIASGELGTGIIQSAINADGQFLNLMLDPTIAGRNGGFTKPGSVSQFAESDDAAAYASMRPATAREREAYAMATKAPMLAAAANRWSVWAAGYGGSEQVGGNAVVGSQDLTARIWGVAAGADYRVSPDTLVGFALGGGGLNYSLANAMGAGSADLFQAGVYGRHNFGPAYVAGALAYGWHDVTTNRTVALAGVDQLQGRFKADSFSARFEGGYRYATPLIGITPYAAVQVTSFNLPNYTETSLNGGGLFALNYAAQTTTDTRSELGLRTDRSYAVQNGVLTLRGRAAWAHDYNPSRAVTSLFTALPGAGAFVVNGARPDADSALVSGSAEVKWLSGFSVAATFDGEFSGNVTTYSGKGVFKYSW
ncbi:autotransporter outer membrane beta-barrel domain-containing protein [Bradyrhizobium liaoningense]|uniref:autotransporter outer membrane beta-barrel domain-containing protein n=1 Tax=Bradyrhizobium liaoningense TaxID=43992 RepID=UPI002013220E|nr:autotransporter outer membrane beta-barrel domain-containing protein [Bradyrhizobium liaoningense]